MDNLMDPDTNFYIDGVLFTSTMTAEKQFTVQSNPRPYLVREGSFEQSSLLETDVVLVDANVQRLYSITHTNMIIIEALEVNKSMETVLDICDKLSEFNFTKQNRLVVIGGGIIQDIGAFTAKIYKRGINWIFYPTTLLAQADSCIGGKCALNFNSQKNQLALFSAPTEVIIDGNFLSTLDMQAIRSGLGEIIKLFLIGGQPYVDLFINTTQRGDDMVFYIVDFIFHALHIKKQVIEHDEFESSTRKALNYGHSFGHAIESVTDFSISHGEAVLLGIDIINRLFANDASVTQLVEKVTSIEDVSTTIDTDKLIEALASDKKMVSSDTITLVNLASPGIISFLPTKIDSNLRDKLHEILMN